MISFFGAIRLGFQRYSDFNGRATRAEFWWGALFAILGRIALTLIDMSIGTFSQEARRGLLCTLFEIGTLIPGLALGARRLHDINRSGWWLMMWLGFFLIIPVIVIVVWSAKKSDKGTNKYGAVPDINLTTAA